MPTNTMDMELISVHIGVHSILTTLYRMCDILFSYWEYGKLFIAIKLDFIAIKYVCDLFCIFAYICVLLYAKAGCISLIKRKDHFKFMYQLYEGI